MKTVKGLLTVTLFLVLLFTAAIPVQALPLAQIRADSYHLSYNIQLAEDVQFLTLNWDMGINNNIGVRAGYIYTGKDANYLDLLLKFKAFEDQKLTLSGSLGLHGSFDTGENERSMGVIFNHSYSQELDLMGSLYALWGEDRNMGWSVGTSYHITPTSSLQVGMRSMAGGQGAGLLLGLVTEL